MALLLAKHVLGMRCVATAAVMSDFDKTKAFVKFENFKSWCVFMFRWVCHASDSGEAALCKWMPKMRNECGLGSLLRFVAGKASTVGSAWEENIPRSSREGRKRVWGFQRFKSVAADATGGAVWANDVSHFLEVFKVRSSSCGIIAKKDALDESRA